MEILLFWCYSNVWIMIVIIGFSRSTVSTKNSTSNSSSEEPSSFPSNEPTLSPNQPSFRPFSMPSLSPIALPSSWPSSRPSRYIRRYNRTDALSFIFLGDWGSPGINQSLVANSMAEYSSVHNASFVIALGDNFYNDGVTSVDDPQWTNTYSSVYHQLSLTNIPWYAILGDHDYHENPEAQIDYYLQKKDNHWTMPGHFYHRTYQLPKPSHQGSTPAVTIVSILIVFVDTCILAPSHCAQTASGGSREVSQEAVDAQYRQIEEVLSSSTAKWKLVAGHFPVYSLGEKGDTEDLVQRLVPLLKQYKVAAYLNGHDHSLQHISYEGINYFTSGNGAWPPAGHWNVKSSIAQDGARFASLLPGFSLATVHSDYITVYMVDRLGSVLYAVNITGSSSGSGTERPTESPTAAVEKPLSADTQQSQRPPLAVVIGDIALATAMVVCGMSALALWLYYVHPSGGAGMSATAVRKNSFEEDGVISLGDLDSFSSLPAVASSVSVITTRSAVNSPMHIAISPSSEKLSQMKGYERTPLKSF